MESVENGLFGTPNENRTEPTRPHEPDLRLPCGDTWIGGCSREVNPSAQGRPLAAPVSARKGQEKGSDVGFLRNWLIARGQFKLHKN